MRMYVFNRKGGLKEILECNEPFKKDSGLIAILRDTLKQGIDKNDLVVLSPDNAPFPEDLFEVGK